MLFPDQFSRILARVAQLLVLCAESEGWEPSGAIIFLELAAGHGHAVADGPNSRSQPNQVA